MDIAHRPHRARSWLPDGRLARRSRGVVLGGLWLHCRTRRRARQLDRLLAAGTDPMESDELSLRVAQLASTRARRRMATELRAAVTLAEATVDTLGMVHTRMRRHEVRANRELLLELAKRLQGDAPVGVEGLARTARMLRERTSPLRRADAERPLSVAALDALAALDRGHLTAWTKTG